RRDGARDAAFGAIGSRRETRKSLSDARAHRKRIDVRGEHEAALSVHENREREGAPEARSLEALGLIEIELTRELEQARRAAKQAVSVKAEARHSSLEGGAAEVVIGKASRLAQRDRAHQSRDRLGGALRFVETELDREAADREGAPAAEAKKAPHAARISARAVEAGGPPEIRRRRAVVAAVVVGTRRRNRIFKVLHAHKGAQKSKWVALRGALRRRRRARGRHECAIHRSSPFFPWAASSTASGSRGHDLKSFAREILVDRGARRDREALHQHERRAVREAVATVDARAKQRPRRALVFHGHTNEIN